MGTNLFVNVEPGIYDAVAQVGLITGLAKRAVVEATIANAMGAEHMFGSRVKAGWRAYRGGVRK